MYFPILLLLTSNNYDNDKIYKINRASYLPSLAETMMEVDWLVGIFDQLKEKDNF